jgi:hypothetical protein
MNQNHIRPRTAAAPSDNRNPRSSIRRCEISIDPRRAYVESVCKVWMEGRFGPGYIFETAPATIDLIDCLELKRAPLYDLSDDGPIGPDPLNFAFSPPSALKITQGRAGHQATETARQKANQMRLLAAAANAINSLAALTPNQGRGSP